MAPWLIVGLLGVLLVGYWSLRIRHNQLRANYNFAAAFHTDLLNYLGSRGTNTHLYTSLLQRSVRMQQQLGLLGIQMYRPPFANHYIHRYAIVLNLLPEIHSAFGDEFLAGGTAQRWQINTIQETLHRYFGEVDEERNGIDSAGRHPLRLFAEGVRALLRLPFLVLRELGVLPPHRERRITQSTAFRVLSGIIGLIGLVSGVVGLIADWPVVESLVARFRPPPQ